MSVASPNAPEVHGTTELAELPRVMIERVRAGSFESVWRVIEADLEEDHAQFFAAGTSPDGSPWPPLADSTVRRKRHDTILRETGRLWGSVAAGDPPDAVRDVIDEGSTKEFAFGTRRAFAALHQRGGERTPQRKFLGFAPGRREQIMALLAEHIGRLALGDDPQ